MTKYHAQPTEVDNVRFASRKEARRYEELKILERAGEIAALQLQPRFPLDVNGVHIGFYQADFQYYSKRHQSYVIEDVKGVRTAVYQLKKRLIKAIYNKEILET